MMEMLLIPVLGGVSLVAFVLVLSLVVVLFRGARQMEHASTFAEEMGLRALNPDAGWKTPKWYGGTHNGREFALASVNVRGGRELGGGAATRILSWSVAIEVLRDAPLPGTPRGELPPDVSAAKKAFRKKYGSLRLGNKRGMQPGVLVPEHFPGRDVVAMVTQTGNAPDEAAVLRMVDALADVVRPLED